MPKAPKENCKDPKDQLSAQCKYCGNKHERKREKCRTSYIWKNMLFAWKSQPFCSKAFQEFTKKKRSQKFKRKKVNQLDDHTESSYSSEEEILSVSLNNTGNAVDMSKFKNKIFAHMEIAHELVKMQVDSGASCNVLPRNFLPRDTEIKKTNLKLTTYSKTNLKVCENPCELGIQRTRRSIIPNLQSLMRITLHFLAF